MLCLAEILIGIVITAKFNNKIIATNRFDHFGLKNLYFKNVTTTNTTIRANTLNISTLMTPTRKNYY